MKQNKFPHNWTEKRVQQLINHYEKQTKAEDTDEDEAAFGDTASQTVIQIPKNYFLLLVSFWLNI